MAESFRTRAERAPLTWSPAEGGRRGWLVFEDDKTYDLGPDTTERFNLIAERMLRGRFYPADAIQVEGRFLDENRPLRKRDRLVQSAPLFCVPGGPKLRAVVEIFVAVAIESTCHIGYVTTEMHFARGIWQAELRREAGSLLLHVKSTTVPSSTLFWLGLPLARGLQLRARRRAVEEFRLL